MSGVLFFFIETLGTCVHHQFGLRRLLKKFPIFWLTIFGEVHSCTKQGGVGTLVEDIFTLYKVMWWFEWG